MTNAIDTGNPVAPWFVVNKYDDIDGSRVAQETDRGRFCFRDSTGRMLLPRTVAEAEKAVFPVDWAKPLNKGPYFLNGNGLNGTTLYPFSDGSLDASESTFTLDPDQAFKTPWPAAVTTYMTPPALYNLAVPSGARCLVYDEGTFTYGSGNYVGYITDYAIGDLLVADYSTAANYGKLTKKLAADTSAVAGSGVTNAVAVVIDRGTFGDQTLTVKAFGVSKL